MRRNTAGIAAIILCLGLWPALAQEAPGRFAGIHAPGFAADVWQVDISDLQGQIVSSALDGFCLVLLSEHGEAGGEYVLRVYDLAHAAKPAAQHTLRAAAPMEAGLLRDGRVYLYNGDTLETTLFDRQLNIQSHFAGVGPKGYQMAYVSPDGSMIWAIDAGEQAIYGFALDGGNNVEYRRALMEKWYYAGIIGHEAGRLYYLLSDESGNAIINTVQGAPASTRVYPVPTGFHQMNGGLWYATSGSQALFTNPLDSPVVMRVGDWQEGEFPLAGKGALLLTDALRQGGEALRVVDLGRGQVRGQLAVRSQDQSLFISAGLLSADGFALLFTFSGENSHNALFIWDFSAHALSADARVQMTSMDGIRAENDQLAEAIRNQWGVRVYYGGSGNDFRDDTYAGSVSEDALLIGRALQQVDLFCQRLPQGMIQEACVPPTRYIAIYLPGTIMQKGGAGILAPAGFSSTYGEERYIVIAMNEIANLMENLAHEFMHAMEDRLFEADYLLGRRMMDDWELLAPQDGKGGYAFAYHDQDGNPYGDTAYTAEDPQAAQDKQRIYFVDPYARTYPLEDRARIFEHLFNADGELPFYFHDTPLQAKAQYLCALIRECFASAQQSAPLWWERFVDTKPYTKLKP